MKIKQKLGDGTLLFDNGMIGTRDLPDFLNGFRNAVVRKVKALPALPVVADIRVSWRAQLAHVYGQTKQAKRAR